MHNLWRFAQFYRRVLASSPKPRGPGIDIRAEECYIEKKYRTPAQPAPTRRLR